ncbi:MAG: MGMT family protein [Thermosphaera sp.]
MFVVTVNNNTVKIRQAGFNDICEAVFILTNLIPVGKISSYSEIGRLLGVHPRLVAKCLMKNENPITTPCHRVVYNDGRVGGYSFGGGKVKAKILQIEGVLQSDEFRVPKNAFFSLEELIKTAS